MNNNQNSDVQDYESQYESEYERKLAEKQAKKANKKEKKKKETDKAAEAIADVEIAAAKIALAIPSGDQIPQWFGWVLELPPVRGLIKLQAKAMLFFNPLLKKILAFLQPLIRLAKYGVDAVTSTISEVGEETLKLLGKEAGKVVGKEAAKKLGKDMAVDAANALAEDVSSEDSKTKKIISIIAIVCVCLFILFLVIGIVIFIILLVVLLVPFLPFLSLVNTGSEIVGNLFGNYSSVSENVSYWWPIGSNEIVINDGIGYASQNPVDTFSENKSFNLEIYDDDGFGTTNIIAIDDGKIIKVFDDFDTCGTNRNSECQSGYGNYIMIEHNNGIISLYGYLHDDSITVKNGYDVKQGQVIGKMGTSIGSNVPALYFTILVNGMKYNPINYVNKDNPRPRGFNGNLAYVNGNSNKQTVCLTLKNSGFSTNAVSALLTNMNAESGFKTTVFGDNGTSFGLCQWHLSRYDNLRSVFPYTYHTVNGQLEFLMYELKNYDLYNSFVNGNMSAADLTYDFCYYFERPANRSTTCRNRANNSNTFVNYVNNGCN